MRKAIAESQHMVLLWSEAAKQSDWVQNERTAFAQMIDQPDASAKSRLLIPIWLQGQSQVLSPWQGIDDLNVAGSYQPGVAPSVPSDLWNRVVNKVVPRLNEATGIPIWLMLFTLTRAEFDDIDPKETPVWAPIPSLETFLANIGVSAAAVADRYHALERAQWRPFGAAGQTIFEVLEDALGTLNADTDVVTREVQFRWQIVGEDFWEVTNDPARRTALREVRQRYALQMLKNRTLIVIDPIAFYARNRKFIFGQFARALHNENAVVLVVPPFAAHPELSQLHEVLRDAVQELSPYYEPPIPAQAFAACGLGICDKSEIQRFLRLAAGQHLRTIEKPARSAVFDM